MIPISDVPEEVVPVARGTRQRMLDSAVELLREGGTGAVTLDAVLSRSDAPRGSVYHHFPGGRNQLLLEAGEQGADFIGALIESVDGGPGDLLDLFLEFWRTALVESDYEAGCPVAALALSPGSSETAQVARRAFARWTDAVARLLVADGRDPEEAGSLASAAVAAVEGAILLARTHRSTRPLDDVARVLRAHLAG